MFTENYYCYYILKLDEVNNKEELIIRKLHI